MYTKTLAFRDFRDKPRNIEIQLNLTEHETMKLLVEFSSIFNWRERLNNSDGEIETPTEEVIEFYNNLEEIILSAYGVLSDDGLYFEKSGRYKFAESAMFNALMVSFLTDPEEATKIVDGLVPKGLQDMIQKANENLDKVAENPQALGGDEKSAALQAEINRLRAQLDTPPAAPTA